MRTEPIRQEAPVVTGAPKTATGEVAENADGTADLSAVVRRYHALKTSERRAIEKATKANAVLGHTFHGRMIVPVLAAIPREDSYNGLRVWCAFCKRWHLHGLGEGHKVAHCHDPESPCSEGYVLVLAEVVR